MKKVLTYIISVIVLGTLLASCSDDYNIWQSAEGPVSMKITLNLPTSAAPATRAVNEENDLEAERRMSEDDLHLLVFEDNELKEDVKNITLSSEQNGTRTLSATTENSYKRQVHVVILTNTAACGVMFNAAAYIGKSKEEVYAALRYNYGDKAWDVVGDKEQRIPMWGAFSITPQSSMNTVSVALYRAVSKMNVLVNDGEGLDNFTLTSVRVYFANQQGYCAPLVEPNGNSPVQAPSSASDFTQFPVATPLVFDVQEDAKALKNRIYVPESDNNNISSGNTKKALCLVVGGKYAGASLVPQGKESFYRIDMKDQEGIYDALRNYLYRFNIKSVSSPGTTTPEEALDHAVVGMKVEIEEWHDINLSGLADQYSLVTDKSRVSFEQDGGEMFIKVWSDYGEDWTIEDLNENWFQYRKDGNRIVLTTDANYGASRESSFYIKSGMLKKQIIVEQAQPGTANCYLVGAGTYELSVVVKGNGTQGLYAENKNGGVEKLDETAVLDPDYLSIIWETSAGLVKLVNPNGSEVTQNADYDKEKGRLKYKVNPNGTIGGVTGGNALIGAFKGGKLIWSWHIWVCPDMAASGYQDEDWTLTGYKVMDRNLGALSNEQGVASLGLLYQWGRKDPFIGASEISKNGAVLDTETYLGFKWGVQAGGEGAPKQGVAYTIEHPTELIQYGLSVTDPKGAYLWGTNGGLNKEGVKDLGRKTIYDPCPVGYRVAPVDAFVFKKENITYDGSFGEPYVGDEYTAVTEVIWTKAIPNKPYRNVYAADDEFGNNVKFYEELYVNQFNGNNDPDRWIKGEAAISYTLLSKSSEKYNWNENLIYIPNNQTSTDKKFDKGNYIYSYSGKYVENAKAYGYYLNYKKNEEPEMNSVGDYYTPKTRENLTWLPLSGAYDPTKGFTFTDVSIEQGPSLTVNSFIWTNSSIKSTDEITRPAALFLHGTELLGGENGRHIHGLTRDDIKAEPHYAGAVRCVRDTKKDFSADNKVPGNISLESTKGSIVEGTLVSINDTWKVVDPGAHWFTISPDHGVADKNVGTKILFTTTEVNSTSTERVATVKIKFASEPNVRTIKVTQKGK